MITILKDREKEKKKLDNELKMNKCVKLLNNRRNSQ